MSSREIAELTGKQHKNVLRDIQRMLEDLEIDEKDGSVLSHQGITKAYDGRGYVSTFGLPKSAFEKGASLGCICVIHAASESVTPSRPSCPNAAERATRAT